MRFPIRNYVTFTSDNGLQVTVLHDAAANMTGGFGGWEVIERPKRVAMTRFKGKDPFRMDVPVLFDGWTDDESQEIAIATLARMAEQPGEMQQPPTLMIEGAVPREDLTWVIETIDWDNQRTIYDMQGGVQVRLRQAAVVHLLQFVDDDVISTPPTLAVVKPKTAVKLVPGAGKTLKQLAAIEYGNPDLWTLIADANGIRDPRKPIPATTTIKVPPKP